MVDVLFQDLKGARRGVVAGLAAPWTTLQPSTITVLAGSQDEIAVEILPPRLPSTAAGATLMTIRAIAQDRADVAAETTIAITHGLRLPAADRGRALEADVAAFQLPYLGFWRVGGDAVYALWPSAPSAQYFTGSIDEVATYTTALTPDQVLAHYHASGR